MHILFFSFKGCLLSKTQYVVYYYQEYSIWLYTVFLIISENKMSSLLFFKIQYMVVYCILHNNRILFSQLNILEIATIV